MQNLFRCDAEIQSEHQGERASRIETLQVNSIYMFSLSRSRSDRSKESRSRCSTEVQARQAIDWKEEKEKTQVKLDSFIVV